MAVQIRNRFPECGVLIFSGHAGTSDLLETANKKGYVFEVLTKPVHPKDLLAKLESAIRWPVESDRYPSDPTRWPSEAILIAPLFCRTS